MTEQSQHDAGAHIISHCKVDDAPAAGVVPLANGEELQQQSDEQAYRLAMPGWFGELGSTQVLSICSTA